LVSNSTGRRAAAILTVALLAGNGLNDAATPPRIAVAAGDEAPQLQAPPVGKDSVTRVRWQAAALTVVNFWATWCEPCKQEIPALETLRKRHGDSLAVYGVVLDAVEDEVVARFATELGAGYPILRGSSDLSRDWGGIGRLPTTFLIDRKGRVQRRYVGATKEAIARLETDVATLLEKAAPAQPPAEPTKP
jgi:thiol-disulfide isomerase/thioredoxin